MSFVIAVLLPGFGSIGTKNPHQFPTPLNPDSLLAFGSLQFTPNSGYLKISKLHDMDVGFASINFKEKVVLNHMLFFIAMHLLILNQKLFCGAQPQTSHFASSRGHGATALIFQTGFIRMFTSTAREPSTLINV